MNATNDELANPTIWQDIEGDFPNCTDVEVRLKTLYLPITYTIVFLVGFPRNFIAICLQLQDEALEEQHHNHAEPGTDRPALPHQPNMPAGSTGSFLNSCTRSICFNFHFNLTSIILFITHFCAFRYMAIVPPVKFFKIQRKWWTAMASTGIWVISLAAVSPVNLLIS